MTGRFALERGYVLEFDFLDQGIQGKQQVAFLLGFHLLYIIETF
jgi:hypothetical protein